MPAVQALMASAIGGFLPLSLYTASQDGERCAAQPLVGAVVLLVVTHQADAVISVLIKYSDLCHSYGCKPSCADALLGTLGT